MFGLAWLSKTSARWTKHMRDSSEYQRDWAKHNFGWIRLNLAEKDISSVG
jgi:hypothetical protein